MIVVVVARLIVEFWRIAIPYFKNDSSTCEKIEHRIDRNCFISSHLPVSTPTYNANKHGDLWRKLRYRRLGKPRTKSPHNALTEMKIVSISKGIKSYGVIVLST